MDGREELDIRQLRGCIGTVCLSGTVKPQFSQARENMRSWNDRNGFTNVEYKIVHGVLVESARDSLVQHMLNENYDYLLQIDADAAPFPENSLALMLQTMFIEHPYLDVLGAYCQLSAPPHLPTIDTGTGTWEEHYPGEGVLSVIRTGAHFIMIKPTMPKLFGPPWFRSRNALTPTQAMKEVDNFARQIHSGQNPLWNADWHSLLHEAAARGSMQPSSVGEDSSFCDSVRTAGGSIGVDTNLVVGHVTDKIILPDDFREHVVKHLGYQRKALGVGW